MTQATIPDNQAIAPQPQDAQERLFTFEEYLEYEGEPDILQELYQRQLIPMNVPTLKDYTICEFLVYQLQRYFADRNLSFVAKTIVGLRTEQNTCCIADTVVCEPSMWEQVGIRGGAGVLDFAIKPILVVEVVGTNRRHDYVVKRHEYELTEIGEYWIIDPKKKQVRVLTNPANEEGYEHRNFMEADTIVSPQFPELVISAQELLNPPLVEELMKAEQGKVKTLEQEAEPEHQPAEKLAQRLRELGINPEKID